MERRKKVSANAEEPIEHLPKKRQRDDIEELSL
jgi:hypothetical protein